jgi:glutathione peroxidase
MTAQISQSIYDLSAIAINGEPISFSNYKDKVILIVNTASQCGFTPQYKGLEELYQKYSSQGLVILGFPCNQFGQQEPGDSQQIKDFCETRFKVTFPLFEKIDVNGENAHPLYQFLSKSAPGIFGTEGIKWNFTKFLVDRQGNVVKRFPSTTKPEDLDKEIRDLL